MKTRKPTDIPAALKTIDINAILRKRGIYFNKEVHDAMKKDAIPIARKLINAKKPKKTVAKEEPQRSIYFTNEQINQYWEKQIHLVEVIEARFEKKIEQFVDTITKGFLKELDQEVDSKKSFIEFAKKDYFSENEDDFLVKAQLDFTPLLNSIATLAGQEANKLIGIKDPYMPFNYEDQIRRNVAKFTHSMLDTDKEALTRIVSSGLQDGLSVPQIRTQIEDTFDDYSKMQAQRITRTEVIRASNQASLDAFEQSGVVEGKQWVTFGAIDECAQYDGKIETLNNSFYSSDSEFQDGDPPLHPNCRCVIIPIVEGSKTYMPDNTLLLQRIAELEGQIDKRTKSYKELNKRYRDDKADDAAYIKALEKHLGVADEPPAEA